MPNFLFDSAFLFGLIMAYLAFVIPVILIFIAAFWQLYSKAGQPGWAILIPDFTTFTSSPKSSNDPVGGFCFISASPSLPSVR
tara:strand:+ start:2969 stop:3217 length:249 start_codon:yes stop_codon:yes gene_type:complete